MRDFQYAYAASRYGRLGGGVNNTQYATGQYAYAAEHIAGGRAYWTEV